jgi:hypothetical protein
MDLMSIDKNENMPQKKESRGDKPMETGMDHIFLGAGSLKQGVDTVILFKKTPLICNFFIKWHTWRQFSPTLPVYTYWFINRDTNN